MNQPLPRHDMMTALPATPLAPAAQAVPAGRKPRILIAGEFSAGKTRLINGLLGQDLLPSNVTATALPPIWLVGGPDSATRVDLSGSAHPLDQITDAGIDDTAFCLCANPAPILSLVDLIDTPGNSDPNMPPETWQRMLDHADAVVWCSNAVQVWRQSEKAVWADMPERLRPGATLLVTHADRLGSMENTRKVMRRVRREAGETFDEIIIASLLEAADVANIAAHLTQLAQDLEVLSGADHPVLAALRPAAPLLLVQPTVTDASAQETAAPVAEVPVTEVQEEPQPALVEAAEMRAEERQGEPAPAAEPPSEPVQAPVASEPLSTPQPEAAPAPTSPAPADPAPAAAAPIPAAPVNIFHGRSRKIWQEVLSAADLSESKVPEALRPLLDIYFGRIDKAFQRIHSIQRPANPAANPAASPAANPTVTPTVSPAPHHATEANTSPAIPPTAGQ